MIHRLELGSENHVCAYFEGHCFATWNPVNGLKQCDGRLSAAAFSGYQPTALAYACVNFWSACVHGYMTPEKQDELRGLLNDAQIEST